MKWVDATSYSRDQPRIQTGWRAALSDLAIVVTKGHIYAKGRWVMHCRPWYDTHDLGPDTIPVEEIQATALQKVRDRLAMIQADLAA